MTKPSIVGVDSSLLVAHTILEHPGHQEARRHLSACIESGDLIALCPIVVNEFLHVVTDSRRFERPLAFSEASRTATNWLESRETRFFPADENAARIQLEWLNRHRLGRKRIHDTLIAAIYHAVGVKTLLTTNAKDFGIFDCFDLIDFAGGED